MNLSSPNIAFDEKLLAVEELLRQRKHKIAIEEFSKLDITDFQEKEYELGLFYSLAADTEYFKSNYKKSIENGIKGVKLLANYSLNRRFGRIQLILSKGYSALGDLKNAEMRARDGLASYRRCGDNVGQADSLNVLAGISFIRCNYNDVIEFLEDGLTHVRNNPRKIAQLRGNLARIRAFTGHWKIAEEETLEVLEYNKANNEETPQAINLLSLAFLQMRLRKFHLASKTLDTALEIIYRLDLKREKFIYLEYAGELAFEKGDNFKAKSLLLKAYEQGLLVAPGSDMVSQSVRRLAEVELALDNIEDAMKYGQKALETSISVGEKIEVGLSKKVIAQIFSAQGEHDDAVEYINQSAELMREVGDPFELARTLLVLVDIKVKAHSEEYNKIKLTLEEIKKIFLKLNLSHWVAEAEFKAGIFYCQHGDLSEGFKSLSKAERIYTELDDNVKNRAVSKFLKSLSEQAVAFSISQENEFKIFGNLITPTEISNIKTNQLDQILEVLLNRSGGDRALVYTPEFTESPINTSFPMSKNQMAKFADRFNNLLGEEISKTKPSIVLDCRRDPFINGLFVEPSDVVASMIVVPFKMGDGMVSYLYLDKISRNNTLNPFSQDELNFAVGFSDIIAFKWAEIQKQKLIEDNLRLKDQLRQKAAFPNIITKNTEMLEMLSQVRQVLNSNISLSIEGETGSGKDVLAQAIHYNSNRRDKRFISVNCAALPETLLESELFGYRRGAFTGADRDKSGLFEEADGGTFFLDEIGDMPLSIQAKVLRILEEKEIVRLGETAPRKVDVRIISATNRDLKELMSEKLFRQDLYYRLSALTFLLPPLRDRKGDIPLLIEHFLKDSFKTFSSAVLKKFVDYDWPGNIRELENEVKKMILLSGDDTEIRLESISSNISGQSVSSQAHSLNSLEIPDEIDFNADFGLYDYLEQHEKIFIEKALKEKKGVKKHAADLLSIPESTLRLKIKQYNIDITGLKKA